MRILFLLCTLLFSSAAFAEVPKLHVVTSFSILEDIAKQIGGDRVEVKSIVGRNMEMHHYEPKPADIVALKHADVFIVNGLGLEGFISRLTEAADFKGEIVEATRGITKIKITDPEEKEEHGEFDPHAWQSLRNGIIYARNIATAFAAKDPGQAAYYNERLKGYILRMNELDAWAKAELARIAIQKRSIIVSHNGFAYLGRDYGIRIIAMEDLATESETSAKKIMTIVDSIRAQSVHAIFLDSMGRSPIGGWVCEEEKIPCGQFYSDALSEKSGKAYTYLELFQANVNAIATVLK